MSIEKKFRKHRTTFHGYANYTLQHLQIIQVQTSNFFLLNSPTDKDLSVLVEINLTTILPTVDYNTLNYKCLQRYGKCDHVLTEKL